MKWVFILFIIPASVIGQTSAEYICDKVGGQLGGTIQKEDFIGKAFRCSVDEQWDMEIMSAINDMVLNDSNITNSRKWRSTYVDGESLTRRSIAVELDGFNVVDIYIPSETKTTYFYIVQT